MQKFLTASILATTALGYSVEENPILSAMDAYQPTHIHSFAQKTFYRIHNEEGYKYVTYGVGIEYNLYRPAGINYRVSMMTNGLKNAFVEAENSLSFRIPLSSDFALYPLLTDRHSSHLVDQLEEKKAYIFKNTLFGGIGCDWFLDHSFRLRAELHGFRDLANILLIQEVNNLYGTSYTNPYGIKGKGGFTSQNNRLIVDFDVYYAHTFNKTYKETGVELAVRWGF